MQTFTLGDMPMGAPPWLFLILLFFIFWLHLMSVWLLLGTAVLGVVNLIKDKNNWQSNKALSSLPIIFAITINLGVPPLLFLQILYAPFFFSSSILIAALWLGVFFLLMLSYGMIYAARYGAKKSSHALLFLSVAAFTILIISFIYSNNMSLMIKPEYWQKLYSIKQNGFNFYPNLPEVIARWIWVLSPSFVMGAALIKKPIRLWALIGAIMSIVGLIIYKSFWTADIANNALVHGALIADLALAGILAVLAFIPVKNANIQSYIIYAWIGFKAAAVVALRHGIREGSLNPVYQLSQIPVSPQPFLIGLFIIFTIVAFIIMGWMFIRGRKGLTI